MAEGVDGTSAFLWRPMSFGGDSGTVCGLLSPIPVSAAGKVASEIQELICREVLDDIHLVSDIRERYEIFGTYLKILVATRVEFDVFIP